MEFVWRTPRVYNEFMMTTCERRCRWVLASYKYRDRRPRCRGGEEARRAARDAAATLLLGGARDRRPPVSALCRRDLKVDAAFMSRFAHCQQYSPEAVVLFLPHQRTRI